LAGAVQNTSSYGLNLGENYLLSQVSSLVPPSLGNGLANAVATQVASVGIQAASSFVQQGIQNLLGFNQAPNITTVGLAQQASRSTISIPDSIVKSLPQMAGDAYTLEDIVFTLVPANAGPQTAPQAQSKPTIPLDVAFNPKVNLSTLGISALKGKFSTTYPATGATVNTATAFAPGKGLVAPFKPPVKSYW
jgi:hypothetical protein